jgi:hypothetical protein
MYTAKNPVIIFTQVFAVSSVFIIPLLFLLLRQQFVGQSFGLIFVFSCVIGLISSFLLLYKFELPKFAFPGFAIHLFALSMITCC